MDKRILVISDIHGCYNEFCTLLNKVEYNPSKDQLILLGDYVNRGENSKKVLEKVIELVNGGAIALRGNHDEWFLKYLFSNRNSFNTFTSPKVGGLETLYSYLRKKSLHSSKNESYTHFIKTHYPHHIQFLASLPYFFETKDYLFVHAGINPKYKKISYNTNRDFIMSRWDFIKNPVELDKTVIFGHTTCKMIHNCNDIWFQHNKIGIDGGCCFGLQLNCLEITNDGKYRTHFVSYAGS